MIFDAGALIALVKNEPGAAAVQEHLSRARMSAINASEAVSVLVLRGMPLHVADDMIQRFRLTIEPFTYEQGLMAASMRPLTDQAGLSFGDRACLALGLLTGQPVLTSDKDWNKVNHGVEVVMIR
jgi:ribonuclease VapC